MRVAVDAREAFRRVRTGKGTWLRALLRSLTSRGTDLLLLVDDGDALQPSGIRTVSFPSGALWHLRATRFLRSAGIDVFLAPTSTIVPAMLGGVVPCVPVVHDLIAFRPEPHAWKARCLERMTVPRALRTAARICTLSNATTADLLRRFPALDPRRIVTVYAGPFEENPPASVPDGKTIVCPGTLCPRKNQERLLRAFASLDPSVRSGWELLLVGARGWQDRAILRLASSTPGARWLGYVSDAAYAALLRSATILALPSLYEGFGLPVLDALQRGIPVLTSSRGSLREVAGDAALFVHPEDTASIADGLRRLLTDQALRGELSRRGPAQASRFSWRRTGDLVLEALHQAAEEGASLR